MLNLSLFLVDYMYYLFINRICQNLGLLFHKLYKLMRPVLYSGMHDKYVPCTVESTALNLLDSNVYLIPA